MPTLYVTEPGARIEKEYKRLLVVKDDAVIASLPLMRISEVVILGSVGVTTQAMRTLLAQGVGLSIITQSGKLLGRLQPARARDTRLLRRQYSAGQDDTLRLIFAREVVRGKLHNSRVMAMRMLRKFGAEEREPLQKALDAVARCERDAAQAKDVEALKGIEGYGARAYFAILRAALSRQSVFSFNKRVRRPPRDPVNALLSLGYTLLANSLITAVEVAGLDPYAGLFHAEGNGKPALALDLMEEFRPLIVDSIVLRMINHRQITEKDFAMEDGQCMLSKKGLRKFLTWYNRRLQTRLTLPQTGRPLSYQKLFEVQAIQVRRLLLDEVEAYQAVAVR
jgi:CRISPR-associated protein Cas1